VSHGNIIKFWKLLSTFKILISSFLKVSHFTLPPFKPFSRFFGRGTFVLGQLTKKELKDATKMCLYAFIVSLLFYKLDVNF